jgi:3-deoxy-D-manno-octulosonic-acid transferase
LERLFAELPEFAAILVPHEPTPHHVQALTEWLERRSIPFLLFSDPELFSQIDSVRALVVDRIGVLANLYAYGDMAYVGGSFGPGVHNVMEPASHGIPVLFGPRILNSPEAQELVSRQAGIRIQNSDEAYRHLRKLLTENGLRRSMGKEAYAFVNANRGATQKTVEKILHFLGEQTGHTSPGQEPRG